MKSFSRTLLTAILAIFAITSAASAAQYHPGDVAVIKNIIKNNLTPAYDPNRPEQWDFVTWSNTSPKRVIGIAVETSLDDFVSGRFLQENRVIALKGKIDITGLSEILSFSCSSTNSRVTSFNAADCKQLKKLECTKLGYPLQMFDISGCTALEELYVVLPKSDQVVVRYDGCVSLKKLDVTLGTLEYFDLAKFPSLEELYCRTISIESLDISKNPRLKVLDCSGNYELMALDISNNPNLEHLDCTDTGIVEVDTSNNPRLKRLDIGILEPEGDGY